MVEQRLKMVLRSGAIEQGIDIERVTGKEAISELFEYQLEFTQAEELDVDALMQSPAELSLYDDGTLERRWGGVINRLDATIDPGGRAFAYTASLVPRAWDTTLHERIDLYLNMDVRKVLETVLERSGVRDYELRLHKHYPVREIVVQYKETDYDFLRRLTQHLGIFFFFEHSEGVAEQSRHPEPLELESHDSPTKLVFSDNNLGCLDLRYQETLSSLDLVGFTSRDSDIPDIVTELRRHRRTLPARYSLTDYNYRNPQVDLSVEKQVFPSGRGHVIEQGAHYKEPEEGRGFAEVRAEALRSQQTRYHGKTNCAALRAGGAFMLKSSNLDLQLLATSLELEFERRSGLSSSFEALERSIAFRPMRDAAVPRIGGLVTGIVEGLLGNTQPDIDEQGRYKVRFLFDSTDKGEAQASHAIRMIQAHSGPGYGMHFPLEPGAEVLVAFVNGDPDRPIIVGSAPNPSQPTPVARPNASTNIIRTVSGVTLEIDDKAS